MPSEYRRRVDTDGGPADVSLCPVHYGQLLADRSLDGMRLPAAVEAPDVWAEVRRHGILHLAAFTVGLAALLNYAFPRLHVSDLIALPVVVAVVWVVWWAPVKVTGGVARSAARRR